MWIAQRQRWWFLGLFSILLVSTNAVRGQTFTNSAVLSAAVDATGTNVVITYTMSSTQGWVTLLSADQSEKLATNDQPVDLAQVPPSGQGQFSVPITSGASAHFYKLLIEQWPSRGKALVWTNGPIDFDAMTAAYGDITNLSVIASSNWWIDVGWLFTYTNQTTPIMFKKQAEVWVDNLGNYDTNGVLVGDNGGMLSGRYATSTVYSLDDSAGGFPPISTFAVSNNDFRVNFLGDTNVSERQAIIWSSQVQFYYEVNDFRNRFLNDSFINSLNLPAELAVNLKFRQFRPDLSMGGGETHAKAVLNVEEIYSEANQQFYPVGNVEQVKLRTRGPYLYDPELPPISFAFGSENSVGDYAGLVQFWLIATNAGFPYETTFPTIWTANMLSAVNNGVSAWVAYRYSGNVEVYRYYFYAVRMWAGVDCGGTSFPCAKGENLRNVMMADPGNTSADGVFPFSSPAGYINVQGPVGANLGGMFVAAVFYDIANEAGLGIYKTDQLVWKMVSLITNNVQFGFGDFGSAIQQAARQLWPDPRPGRQGLSLYEEDIVDVLTSRGIPMNGVADFKANLPSPVGPVSSLTPGITDFASVHPTAHPSVNQYGQFSGTLYSYTLTNLNAAYVAIQFYKHSKYGPCDELDLTDGTFNTTNSVGLPLSAYDGDGSYYLSLKDRELGNLVLLVPGTTVRALAFRERCPNEATGFYAEDVRPFGFIVTKATANGFSFAVSALATNDTFKTYQLTLVDPSTNTLGAATYNWTFTDYTGNTFPANGPVVQYPAYIDEPFTISIDRTRNGQTDNLTLRERGNDLDRNNGQAFVRNLVP